MTALIRMTLLTALAAGSWAVVFEPDRLVTNEVELDAGWTGPPLRVVLLTDLHVGSMHTDVDKIRTVVERTNALEPDLVVLAGDYINHSKPGGETVPPEDFAPILGDLRAKHGVFAVLGNHDWWYDGPRVATALEEAGVPILEDEAVRIEIDGEGFWVAGIGDSTTRNDDVPATEAALTTDEPVIAITHTPDVFAHMPERFDLTVAGHTHGGQVWLPFVGSMVVPSAYGQKYVNGHIIEDGRHMYVSPGIGTSMMPVRFLVPPEITVLEL